MVNYTGIVSGEKTNKQREERRHQNQYQKKMEQKTYHLNATVITVTQQEVTAGGAVLTMKQSWYRLTKYQSPSVIT